MDVCSDVCMTGEPEISVKTSFSLYSEGICVFKSSFGIELDFDIMLEGRFK